MLAEFKRQKTSLDEQEEEWMAAAVPQSATLPDVLIEDMSLDDQDKTRKEYLNKGTVLTDIDEHLESENYGSYVSNVNSFISKSSD